MHLHHAHGLQRFHIEKRHTGHRIELPDIGFEFHHVQAFAGGAPSLNQADTEKILRSANPGIKNIEGVGPDRRESERPEKLRLLGLSDIHGEIGKQGSQLCLDLALRRFDTLFVELHVRIVIHGRRQRIAQGQRQRRQGRRLRQQGWIARGTSDPLIHHRKEADRHCAKEYPNGSNDSLLFHD